MAKKNKNKRKKNKNKKKQQTSYSKSAGSKGMPMWLAPILGTLIMAGFAVVAQLIVGSQIIIAPVAVMGCLGLAAGAIMWARKVHEAR